MSISFILNCTYASSISLRLPSLNISFLSLTLAFAWIRKKLRQASNWQKDTLLTDTRPKILLEPQHYKTAGHPGISNTFFIISPDLCWPFFKIYLISHIQSCGISARSKNPKAKTAGLLMLLSILVQPGIHLSMDFIVELPHSQGCSVIGSLLTSTIKWPTALPYPSCPQPVS